MVSKLGRVAPRRRMVASSSRANSASVGPVSSQGRSSARAASATAAAASMRASSPASLVRRSCSTRPLVATRAVSGNHSRVVAALGGPAHVVGLEADAGGAGEGLGDDAPLLGAGDLEAGLDAGGGELVGGLLGVAAVGDEQQLVGGDGHARRRSR